MTDEFADEIVFGKLLGQSVVYLLEEPETEIGRDESCDLVLESKSISKHHATLSFLDQQGIQAEIVDHTTRNGTFVNDERIWNKKKLLEHGDIIRFGYDIATFRFEYTNPQAIARIDPSKTEAAFSSPFGYNQAFFIPIDENGNENAVKADQGSDDKKEEPQPSIEPTPATESEKQGKAPDKSSIPYPANILSSTMHEEFHIDSPPPMNAQSPTQIPLDDDNFLLSQEKHLPITLNASVKEKEMPKSESIQQESEEIETDPRSDSSPLQSTLHTKNTKKSIKPKELTEKKREELHKTLIDSFNTPLPSDKQHKRCQCCSPDRLKQPDAEDKTNLLSSLEFPSRLTNTAKREKENEESKTPKQDISRPFPSSKPQQTQTDPQQLKNEESEDEEESDSEDSGSSRSSSPPQINITFPPPPPRPSEEEQIFFDDVRNRSRQTDIARARIEGSSKVEREAEIVEMHRQKAMEEAKERMRVELSMLTPDVEQSDSDSSEERVEREMKKTKSRQRELDTSEQRRFNSQPRQSFSGQFGPGQTTSRALHALSVDLHSKISKIIRKCLLRSEHGFEEADAKHKSKMDVGEEKQMAEMATRRLQKARIELAKCGAGGESVGDDYFDDSEEREEEQRQAVKRRLRKEKETILMETEMDTASERRRAAEQNLFLTEQSLAALASRNSHLHSLLDTITPNPSPSTTDLQPPSELQNDINQLRRLLTHKQNESDFLIAAMRDRIQNETTNTNNHAIRQTQKANQDTSQFGEMSATDIVNAFVEEAEMNERLSGAVDKVVQNWKRVKTENKKLSGQSSFLSPNDPVPPSNDPLLNQTSQEDTITAMQRSLREKEVALKLLLLELSGKGVEEKRRAVAMIAENERIEEERLQNGMKGHERERSAEIACLRDVVDVMLEESRNERERMGNRGGDGEVGEENGRSAREMFKEGMDLDRDIVRLNMEAG
ncbi:putative FHA domain containing protein [Blattamonas nauphoetae]|uniref:FHA domain containing protein n=1 Tax=Blattamonas nauphoetae TaxID=2049346 RepID=A0ABQ9XYR3_9EUKA|nr:putative FHA domain containing protein [Blattamonas nauphoetae]